MSCRTKVRGLVILNDVSRIPLSFSFSMLLQKCLLFCFIFLDNVSQHLSLLTSVVLLFSFMWSSIEQRPYKEGEISFYSRSNQFEIYYRYKNIICHIHDITILPISTQYGWLDDPFIEMCCIMTHVEEEQLFILSLSKPSSISWKALTILVNA